MVVTGFFAQCKIYNALIMNLCLISFATMEVIRDILARKQPMLQANKSMLFAVPVLKHINQGKLHLARALLTKTRYACLVLSLGIMLSLRLRANGSHIKMLK